MRSSEWQRLRAVVEEALDRPSTERAEVLDTACGADQALRGEAESILAAEDAAGDFLDPTQRARSGRALRPGDWVDGLRLVRRISEGGTATVWLAHSAGLPAGPALAVKIAHGDLAAGDLPRRFTEEGRILSRLTRLAVPGVVRLRNAGHHRGRPYLVLDLVEGEPLDTHCDSAGLGLEERLGLVRALAEIVAALHRARIVHRDLKPGNVLVRSDGRPTLIDFGLARRLGDRRGSVLGHPTEPLARLITPGYAPPEQVWGGPITPALDVFGLGALTHRLLVGETPPGPGQPVRPSRIAATVPPEVSGRLGLSPRALARRLRGDLDRVLTRALEPFPGNRHADAAELAADLDRYLSGLRSAGRRGLLASITRGALAVVLGRFD